MYMLEVKKSESVAMMTKSSSWRWPVCSVCGHQLLSAKDQSGGPWDSIIAIFHCCRRHSDPMKLSGGMEQKTMQVRDVQGGLLSD